MPNIIMPRENWDPLYRKEKELRKKKALEWAKKHGCYEEVKKYYEMKEWMEKYVVYHVLGFGVSLLWFFIEITGIMLKIAP